MTNNDILRRLRFTTNLTDAKLVEIGTLGGAEFSEADITSWLIKDEEDESYRSLQDLVFAQFLNGLIIHKRGPSDKGMPEAESKLSNNGILRKLKIAFNLQNDDILEVLDKSEFKISKHELSAFFRKVGHKHYRELKDQILRNFLNGLQKKVRPIQDLEAIAEAKAIADSDSESEGTSKPDETEKLILSNVDRVSRKHLSKRTGKPKQAYVPQSKVESKKTNSASESNEGEVSTGEKKFDWGKPS